MDYDLFKMIHSELIMSVQYIEEDLRIIYSTIKPGSFAKNYAFVDKASLGKLLKELHELDEEIGFAKIKENDYVLLDLIREKRNYWCHRCYLDFHYIEDPAEHDKRFFEVAKDLQVDEQNVYELSLKIEKLRKSVVKKYRHRGNLQ